MLNHSTLSNTVSRGGKKDYRNFVALKGHQGNFWKRYSTTIAPTSTDYQVKYVYAVDGEASRLNYF